MIAFSRGERLSGKVAIVTGAGNGIGACTARLFAAQAARVVLTDIDATAVTAVANEIESQGGKAIALEHDIASESAWDRIVTKAVSKFGKISVLVNNAGIHLESHMRDITLADWNRIIAVDLTGPFLGIQRVIPEMLKAGGGSIVNVSSVAALIGGSFAHYSAAKAGVRALTRTTAITYAKDRIRANTVFPGLIKTNLTKDARANPEILKMLQDATALPDFGEPHDIAYGILYLSSDEAAFATGSDLVIDGGVTAK